MRQPTLDEAARIIDAGDAMAEALRAELPYLSSLTAPVAVRAHDDVVRLVDAWRDATREVAP